MLTTFPVLKDERGSLIPVEFKDFPFTPVRAFTVTGVPAGTWRGGHAHYRTEQILICVRGTVEYSLDYGRRSGGFAHIEESGILRPGNQVFVPKLVWDSQRFATEDTVLLVLCSTHYDSADYIRDYQEFTERAAKGLMP